MLRRATAFVHDLIRKRTELLPPGFSWPFFATVDLAWCLIVIGASAQRVRTDPVTASLAALIAMAPLVWFLCAATKFSPAIMWTTTYTAVTIWLFAASTPIPSDFAPVLLVLAVSCVAALTPLAYGIAVLGSAIAMVATAAAIHRLDDVVLYLCLIVLGLPVGITTRIQAELLVKQWEMQADLAEHAATDERRRIAREVHDVIAHSLAVTLLHVTGARRALQQDRDVDDAVEALRDAERLGRQAMADIRSTVGLLEDGPSGVAPEPGVTDIPTLIADFVQAGMQVSFRTDGPQDLVSPAVGLALYRIAQESLTNVAKHAPSATAQVGLLISPDAASLSVVNEVPAAVASASRDGRGLAGMRQRVQLLGGVVDAGPCRQGWSVRADIPLTDEPLPRRCSLT